MPERFQFNSLFISNLTVLVVPFVDHFEEPAADLGLVSRDLLRVRLFTQLDPRHLHGCRIRVQGQGAG